MELLFDTVSVFIGFILGIFFEKWTENRSEKKWLRLARIVIPGNEYCCKGWILNTYFTFTDYTEII